MGFVVGLFKSSCRLQSEISQTRCDLNRLLVFHVSGSAYLAVKGGIDRAPTPFRGIIWRMNRVPIIKGLLGCL